MERKTLFLILCISFIVVDCVDDKDINEDELPSKVQQRNLIETGRELCRFIRDAVTSEAKESGDAIRRDVEFMIKKAKKLLNLQQENQALKISCTSNNVKSRAFLDEIPKIRQEVEDGLKNCEELANVQARDITENIQRDAQELERRTQEILDDYHQCSKKGSLSMFSCYRKVTGSKIAPMKEFLMDMLQAHSRAHTDFLTARSSADICIDMKVTIFSKNIENFYNSLA